MDIKLSIPADLTAQLVKLKGNKSLAAYVVLVLRNHVTKEVNNEEGSATVRNNYQSYP